MIRSGGPAAAFLFNLFYMKIIFNNGHFTETSEYKEVKDIVCGGNQKQNGVICPTVQIQKNFIVEFSSQSEFQEFINKMFALKTQIAKRQANKTINQASIF